MSRPLVITITCILAAWLVGGVVSYASEISSSTCQNPDGQAVIQNCGSSELSAIVFGVIAPIFAFIGLVAAVKRRNRTHR